MGLQDWRWRRFLRGPDQTLLTELYEPALSRARRYDRSCAYFSSSVLAAAARGFGPLIETLLASERRASEPPIRFVVNEQLSRADVNAILEGADSDRLAELLLAHLTGPKDELERNRLAMLGLLVKQGWLGIRVGLMRQGEGIVHAKFGIVTDEIGDSVVFMGSGNESAAGLLANYEELEISTSWQDADRLTYYRDRFEALWQDRDSEVTTLALPDAVRLQLIKYAQEGTGEWPPRPIDRATTRRRLEAAMRWQFALEAPYFQEGERSCDATAPIGLWPHQIRVVEESAAAWPAGRLLCDEVGMGKTVEAIMVLRRLLAGRGVERALLLVPAGLLKQWQGELREKGGLVVPRLEGPQTLAWPDGTTERLDGLSAALGRPLLLMSREFARLEQNAAALLQSPSWDLVLLDEAHAARRAKQEEGEFNSATLLLALVRSLQLEGRARGILLLSATPMQTHPWEPWDLLSVLGEGAPWLADFSVVRQFYEGVALVSAGPSPLAGCRRLVHTVTLDSDFAATPVPPAQLPMKLAGGPSRDREELARWLRRGAPLGRRMHRNTRATLRKYHQQGLLKRPPPERVIQDARFEYRDLAERDLYEAITTYVNRRFAELEAERPGKGFVMTVYRRRATSSPYALDQSLRRRAEGLRRVARQQATDEGLDLDAGDEQDFDEFFQGERHGRLSSGFPDDPQTAAQELKDVERLLAMLRQLQGTDSKFEEFLRALQLATDDGRAALVFSEFADTVTYLRDQLFSKYGAALACYTGDGGQVWGGERWVGVSKDEITTRLRRGELRVLLCTDAASEGLNLQAAAAVINYDLPWNPSRVEQRIGRIDRIGQQADVVRVANMVLADSVDERVYQVLEDRCGLFRHFVGPMQPVLAEARQMLLGVRPFDETVLRAAEERVRADAAALASFADAAEVPGQASPPGLVLEQLVRAFQEICSEGVVEIDGRPRRVAWDAEELDRDETAWPLSPLAAEFRDLGADLVRHGELLPLVCVVHRDGPFRAAEAMWVGADGFETVERFERLDALLGQWNGFLVEPKKWIEAEREASRRVRERVSRAKEEAATRERRGLERQVEAAGLRLQRELGRYLLCLDPNAADLNQTLHNQRQRDIASAARLNQAYELIGYPQWDPELVSDLRQEAGRLTANQRKNVLLGSPLDAALADPRWRARTVQERRE